MRSLRSSTAPLSSPKKGLSCGCLLLIPAAVVLAIVFHAPLLTSTARVWVIEDEGKAADVVVILGGQIATRPARAAEIVHNERASLVYLMREVHHPVLHADTPAGERADEVVRILNEHGIHSEIIVLSETQVSSTREEAAEFARWIDENAPDRRDREVILVTDAFHSRRALRDFRQAAPSVQFQVTSPPHRKYTLRNWWETPEGRFDFRSEVVKYFASRIIGK